MESPLHVQPPRLTGSDASERPYGHSFSTNLGMRGQFVCARDGSFVVLDTSATANLVRFAWMGNRNLRFRKMGFPKLIPYPTMARLKFGDGRVDQVRRAAGIQVGTVGRRGTSTACVLGVAIPALLRKGALGALRGQVDCERDISAILNQ